MDDTRPTTGKPGALPLGATRADQFESLTFPSHGWLIDGIWRVEGCGVIAGFPKGFKSFLALDMSIAIVSGEPFLGHATVAPGAVVYVDAESLPSDLQERVRMLRLGRGLSPSAIRDLFGLHPLFRALS